MRYAPLTIPAILLALLSLPNIIISVLLSTATPLCQDFETGPAIWIKWGKESRGCLSRTGSFGLAEWGASAPPVS